MLNFGSWAERYWRKHWFDFNAYWIASKFGMRKKHMDKKGLQSRVKWLSGTPLLWPVMRTSQWQCFAFYFLLVFPTNVCWFVEVTFSYSVVLGLGRPEQAVFVFNPHFCHLGKLGRDICVDLLTEVMVSIWFCNSLLGRVVLNLVLLFSFLSENNEVRRWSSHFLAYLHS